MLYGLLLIGGLACGDDTASKGDGGPGSGKNDAGPDAKDAATSGKDAAQGSADGGDIPTGSATIDAANGGKLKSEDEVLLVDVPAGALAEDTLITIRKLAAADIPPEVKVHGLINDDVYEIEPSGLKFDKPVIVTWSYAKAPDATTPDDHFVLLGVGLFSADGTLEYIEKPSVKYGADGSLVIRAPIEHLSVPFYYDGDHDTMVTLEDDMIPPLLKGEVGLELLAFEQVHEVEKPWTGAGGTLIAEKTAAKPDFPFIQYWAKMAEEEENFPAAPTHGQNGDFTATGNGPFEFEIKSPTYECGAVAQGTVFAEVILNGTTATNSVSALNSTRLSAIIESPMPVDCVEGSAIYLADNQHLARSGDELVAAGGIGAVANVVHPTAAVIKKMSATAGGAVIYEGVPTFGSLAGPSSITLSSSLQTGTAAHDGSRYAITGVTGSAVFAASDTLTVSGTPSGASSPVEVTVAAPAPVSIASLFGTLDGLRTEISQPDGSFDAFAITVTLTGSSKNGEAGLLRVIDAKNMTLRSGKRAMPILDDATIAALEARGLVPDQVYVSVINQKDDDKLFPGEAPTPVQAGRSFQVAAEDLAAGGGGTAGTNGGGSGTGGGAGSSGSGGGGATVAQCGAFPATIVGGSTISPNTASVVLCLDPGAGSTCFASDDTYSEGASSQCTQNNQALLLSINSNGPESVYSDYTNWNMIWSSSGSLGQMVPSGGANDWVILERSDGQRRKVDFTLESNGYTLESVATHSGALPSVGARHDCASLPKTFSAPATSTNPYASLCLNDSFASPHCSVIGDAAASTQDDACDDYGSYTPIEFGYATNTSVPWVSGGSQGQQWSLVSASHGCIKFGDLTKIPSDGTDVTVVVENSGHTKQLQVVFDWNGSQFTILSQSATSGVAYDEGPSCYTPVVTACSALPSTVPPIDGWNYGASSVLCIDSNTCRVSNDPDQSTPLKSAQCDDTLAARALTFDPEYDQVCVGTGWNVAWSSDGPASGCVTATGTNDSVIVQRVSDKVLYKVDYAFSSVNDDVLVSSAAVHAGALPSVGAKHDCASAPKQFGAPGFSADEVRYAGVCLDDNTKLCSLVGDYSSTSQNENCESAAYLVELGVNNLTGEAYARTVSYSGWTVKSSSHGTIDGFSYRVDGLPNDGTTVTLVMTNGTTDYAITFHYDGTYLSVLSVGAI